GKPENPQQMNVPLHAPGALLHHRHRPYDLLAALAAKCLARLHCRATSIAEHDFLRAHSYLETSLPNISVQQMIRKARARVQSKCLRLELSFSYLLQVRTQASPNEKATRQQGGLFFSRENSSNGR